MSTTYRCEGHRRFAALLAECPKLLPYWDFSTGDLKPEALERAMGAWSHGEQIMARFFVGVWFHEDKWGFSFTDAASTLDSHHSRIIAEWIINPFWP